MKQNIFSYLLIAIAIVGCTERIVEYQIPDEYTNDLLPGDLVGRVVQKNSGAVVIISQVGAIDSVAINPQDGSFTFRNLRIGNYDVTIRAANLRIYLRSNVAIQGGGLAFQGNQ